MCLDGAHPPAPSQFHALSSFLLYKPQIPLSAGCMDRRRAGIWSLSGLSEATFLKQLALPSQKVSIVLGTSARVGLQLSTTLLCHPSLSGLILCMLSQLLSVQMSDCAVLSGKHCFSVDVHCVWLSYTLFTSSSTVIPEPWGDEV